MKLNQCPKIQLRQLFPSKTEQTLMPHERKTVARRMQEDLDWSDADWDEIFKEVGGVA